MANFRFGSNDYSLFSGAPHDDTGTTENFTWTRAVATAARLLARLEDLP
ncbi:hypothetical protein OG806_49420 [Streptomyces sp. NBC_00882]|nr:hypothetical protein OG806_00530 [Streptomyces sp. NBC_00882]WSZ36839.1 hypothetical protein OG806_49420 [Streptomyces sp. NBC_00882]